MIFLPIGDQIPELEVFSKFKKGKNIIDLYYQFHLRIYRLYTMVNDQKRKFNKNHVLSIRLPMHSLIDDMEYEVTKIGMRIIESNITANPYDGLKDLIQEP